MTPYFYEKWQQALDEMLDSAFKRAGPLERFFNEMYQNKEARERFSVLTRRL